VTEIQPIAHIESDFGTKFGIPRQAGLVEELHATVVFENGYRNDDALRGIDGYSHLWLIWQFSGNTGARWSPTVRPPRLGGNIRMGVFATRSTFRPNFLGLSCVKLEGLRKTPDKGTVLLVQGADLMNGTPIFDIKPYIPYSDCIPDAREGFATRPEAPLQVLWKDDVLCAVPAEKRDVLEKVLSCDPRPRYQDDPDRIYGMEFAGMDVRFQVVNSVLRVIEIREIEKKEP